MLLFTRAVAMLRYYVGGSVLSRTAAPFPTATFVINITGSFLIGFFLEFAAERVSVSLHPRLAVAVGFVGAYTTFSTLSTRRFGWSRRGVSYTTCSTWS